VIVVDQRSSVFQAIGKIANLIRFRIPVLFLKQAPFADNASIRNFKGAKKRVLKIIVLTLGYTGETKPL
jgi:hypothetical protein